VVFKTLTPYKRINDSRIRKTQVASKNP